MEEITKEERKLLILKDKVELVLDKKIKPNSFEIGSVGSRFKIYFEDAEDLDNQIKELKKKGYMKDE